MHTKASYAPAGTGIYAVFVAVMAVTLVLSNLGAAKGVTFGPLVTDGGFFLFPLAYIVGDVISEVYGFKASRLAIYTTFGLSAFTAACFWVIIMLPAASWYDGQAALERILGPVPLIVLGSLLGFLSGQLINAYLMAKLKKRSGEKLLFGRLALSTLAGEFCDTLVFCAIAAGIIGITDFWVFLQYLFLGFLFKTGVEIIISPLTIWVIKQVKSREPQYSAITSTRAS